jgi:hypothetical protein
MIGKYGCLWVFEPATFKLGVWRSTTQLQNISFFLIWGLLVSPEMQYKFLTRSSSFLTIGPSKGSVQLSYGCRIYKSVNYIELSTDTSSKCLYLRIDQFVIKPVTFGTMQTAKLRQSFVCYIEPGYLCIYGLRKLRRVGPTGASDLEKNWISPPSVI